MDPEVRRSRHREMLVLSATALLLSCLFSMTSEGGIKVPLLPERFTPKLCFSQELFGAPCPGCGLTRSFVLIAHGDFIGAFHMHRLSWILFAVTALQIPYRLLALRRMPNELIPIRVARLIAEILVVALVLNWLIGGILCGWSSPN